MQDAERRLRWLCRRGMKELDVMLAAFLAQGFEQLDETDRQRFAALLEWQDPELFAVLSGQQPAPDRESAAIVRRIRDSAGL